VDCPFCGGSNPAESKFCMHCGAPLTGPEAEAAAQQPQAQTGTPITPQMGAQRPAAPPQPTAVQPGAAQPAYAPPAAPAVPNHLVWAILVTLFCCLPFGIVAIVYASQVNTKLNAGDYEGAVRSSQNAKTWCWVSFGIGLFFTFAYVVLVMIGALAEM